MGHKNLFPPSKLPVPSGYLLHGHGKNHHAIKNGKPSISMGHRKTMAMLVIARG